jgi:esterase/lipase superfamily enzyme
MGNFVLQNAMHTVWTRKNQPLLVSLVNQLLMVAADVDNDLFESGEATHDTDGDAIANLTYRVTALYTGRDPVLGLSAGLKHFGKRRLGRSGLDRTCPVPDNVWDVDCSTLIPPNAGSIHSSYFDQPKTIALMRELLRGIDRQVLVASGVAPQSV